MKLWFSKGAWASKSAEAKLSRLEPEQVKTIVVIRHAALGDMVLTRPFLVELRKFFPNAKITLSLVSNYTRGVPKDLVDRVHMAYGSDRRDKSPFEQIKQARKLGYHDIVFDVAATTRSIWVCVLNKAGFKIGFPYSQLQRRLFYDAAVLRSDMKFEAETMLDMLRLLGFQSQYPPEFQMSGEQVMRDRPYIAYFTSASCEYKCWPKEYFAQLIGKMAEAYPEYDHVILEGVEEWESIDEILASNQERANVTGEKIDGVEETVCFLKGASMLVSNDTGIRHLAIASGTPTVGIFFAKPPYNTSPFRYWPHFGCHDVVFKLDGDQPDVDSVYDSACKIMMKPSDS